ncbi:MAG: FtsW/RodA/SpoVE family cell cycle protein [Bacteroidales bacterium]|nr:FtsW/RodA/SpoVE family cell cycle protein [Bacteroidales bacterium]
MSVKTFFKGDKAIWSVLAFLVCISLVAVYSSTGKLASRTNHDAAYYMLRQGGFIAVGFIGILLITNFVPIKLIRRFALAGVVVAFVALIAAYAQFKLAGDTAAARETARELRVGPVRFQPAELAKLTVMIFIASTLAACKRSDSGSVWRTFWTCMITVGVFCLIFIGLKFGTSSAIMLFVAAMFLQFVAQTPWLLARMSVWASAVVMLVGLYVAAPMFPNVGRIATLKSRIDNFLVDTRVGKALHITVPPATADDAGLFSQADYSKLAIYEGGLTGKGPGHNDVSNYMEAAYNDFIFSIIIEEYGWILFPFILFLFVVFFFRCLKIFNEANTMFPALLTAGLSLMIMIQAFVNMCVAVGIGPVTGQPMPLVSVGGTSIVFTAAAFGIILRADWERKIEKARETAEQQDAAPTVNAPDGEIAPTIVLT